MESAFLRKIEEQNREIRRDREDIQRLLERYPGYDFVQIADTADKTPIPTPPTPTPTGIAFIHTSTEEDRLVKPLSALEQAILALIDAGPQVEWTSRAAVTAIRAGSDYRLSDNDDAAMNAVGLALTCLRDPNKIVRIHEGRGRDPHRYRGVSSEKEVTPEETTS